MPIFLAWRAFFFKVPFVTFNLHEMHPDIDIYVVFLNASRYFNGDIGPFQALFIHNLTFTTLMTIGNLMA